MAWSIPNPEQPKQESSKALRAITDSYYPICEDVLLAHDWDGIVHFARSRPLSMFIVVGGVLYRRK